MRQCEREKHQDVTSLQREMCANATVKTHKNQKHRKNEDEPKEQPFEARKNGSSATKFNHLSSRPFSPCKYLKIAFMFPSDFAEDVVHSSIHLPVGGGPSQNRASAIYAHGSSYGQFTDS